MYQIVQQSRAEKVAMYMRVNKRKLVDMLIACNDTIDSLTVYGAAPITEERRATVRQQRKQYICPKCGKDAWYSRSEHRWRCCMGASCRWAGKRPAIA